MFFYGEELGYFDVKKFVSSIFEDSQHSKRVQSIAHATLGIIAHGSLIISRIGRGMAEVLNLSDKHAIKQVDRLLSNKKLAINDVSKQWVPYLLGGRKEAMVTMDWTEFDKDSQATLSLNLVTSHGRATLLMWKTVNKSTLKNNRNNHEDDLLSRFKACMPEGVKVTILANRGFCDIKCLEFLKNALDFEYIIRIRSNILVENQKGETKKASQWISDAGKTKTLKKIRLTHKKYAVPMHAIATVVLTLLGAAGEKIGLDRYLKCNTVKKRTLSLFNQGCIYFRRIFGMVKETAKKLLETFYCLVEENKKLESILGVI